MVFERSSLLLMLAVALALPASAVDSSTAGPSIPQQAAHPTLLAQRLGLSTQGLKAKMPAVPYQANPVAESGPGVAGVPPIPTRNSSVMTTRPSAPNIIGTFSVEKYPWDPSMNLIGDSHPTAAGFRNYLAQWYKPNFAFEDSQVIGTWYRDCDWRESLDCWNPCQGDEPVPDVQDCTDIGIDAVAICWHSGHGGLDLCHKEYAPCMGGAVWDDPTTHEMLLGADSTNNVIGGERLRYMFWDTCSALLEDDIGGNFGKCKCTPVTVWGKVVRGIRMMFGFNGAGTATDGLLGKYFWEEWSKNKPLSIAWIDAYKRCGEPYIQPAAFALGSTATDASNRLYNEHLFFLDAVRPVWAAWCWYSVPTNPTPKNSAPSNNLFSLSAQVDSAALASVHPVLPRGNSNEETMALGKVIGLQIDDPGFIEKRPFGLCAVHTEGATLFVEANGNFELSLLKTPATEDRPAALSKAARPLSDAIMALSEAAMIEKARVIASALQLPGTEGMTLGHICDLNANDSEISSDRPGGVHIIERTVVFDQMVDGLPFVDSDAGHLAITFDVQSGQPTHLRCTLRQVNSATNLGSSTGCFHTLDSLRAEAIKTFESTQTRANRTMPTIITRGEFPAEQTMPIVAKPDASAATWEVIPETERIGFKIIDGEAVPVYRAAVRNSRLPDGMSLPVVVPLAKN